MSQNLSVLERLVRIGLGLAFATALLEPGLHRLVHPAWWLLPGALLATGLTGYCPLYWLRSRFTPHRP